MFFSLYVNEDTIGSRNLKKGMIWEEGVELNAYAQ